MDNVLVDFIGMQDSPGLRPKIGVPPRAVDYLKFFLKRKILICKTYG